MGRVEVFGDRCELPVDDPEDAGIITFVTAAVAGPGVGGPFSDGVLAVGNDPVDIFSCTTGTSGSRRPNMRGKNPSMIPSGPVHVPEAGRPPRRIQVASGVKAARNASMSPARRARKKFATAARLVSVEACRMSFSSCVMPVCGRSRADRSRYSVEIGAPDPDGGNGDEQAEQQDRRCHLEPAGEPGASACW